MTRPKQASDLLTAAGNRERLIERLEFAVRRSYGHGAVQLGTETALALLLRLTKVRDVDGWLRDLEQQIAAERWEHRRRLGYHDRDMRPR